MSDFIEHCLGRVLALQVRLYACQARLADCTDTEALHDLRIALRQLRSLLRPLRGFPAVDVLEQGAAVLGRLSGPLRDREVLVAELARMAWPIWRLSMRRSAPQATLPLPVVASWRT